MEDDVVALGEARHEAGVAHVAALDRDRLVDLVVEAVEPAGGAEGVVERERRDLGPGGDQRLDQVRADEAVGARDQDALAAICRQNALSLTAAAPATARSRPPERGAAGRGRRPR